ncbi:MAG: hypothetical protein ACREV8_15385, partial [Gammaproteobacteria bacterium]
IVDLPHPPFGFITSIERMLPPASCHWRYYSNGRTQAASGFFSDKQKRRANALQAQRSWTLAGVSRSQ